jgi:hypothetical protein
MTGNPQIIPQKRLKELELLCDRLGMHFGRMATLLTPQRRLARKTTSVWNFLVTRFSSSLSANISWKDFLITMKVN